MNIKRNIRISFPTVPFFCYTNFSENVKGELNMDLSDPTIVELSVRLAEATAKNTATAISNKIRALKTEKDDKKTIAEMTELIYEILDEKQEVEIIAKSYQEELVAQKLTSDDLNFVVDTVIPAIKEFIEKSSKDPMQTSNQLSEIEALEPLLSLNTLMVLQTLGFNYKKGIGEPLTNLVSALIRKNTKNDESRLVELATEREIEYFKLLQNSEAFERLQQMNGNNN